MALTVQAKLASAFPDAKIFMRVDPTYSDVARDNGFVPVNGRVPVSPTGKLKSKVTAFSHYLFDDAIIDIGGYQFGDPWGVEQAIGTVKRLRYCNRFGTKTLFMPQAMGPFTDPAFRYWIPRLIKESSLFYIRDKQSFEEVSRLYPVQDLLLQPDIAWSFNAGDISVEDIIAKYEIDKKKSTLCVTPNLRVYERHGEEYLSLLLMIIDLAYARGYQIIVLGHELRVEQDKVDDRFLGRILKERRPTLIHVDEFLSARQVKKLIGLCDFVVSSRFHALIAAFSQMIPAIAIGWSHKYDGLLADVGLAGNSVAIPYKRDAAKSQIAACIDGTETQKQTLRERVPDLCVRSENVLAAAIDVLR